MAKTSDFCPSIQIKIPILIIFPKNTLIFSNVFVLIAMLPCGCTMKEERAKKQQCGIGGFLSWTFT